MNGKEQRLPDNQKEANQLVTQQVTAHFSGPLPHPTILEQYDKIVPGVAERIIVMAEKQSAHRREQETKVIDSDIKNSKLGLYFGFGIGLAGLATTVLIAVFSNPYLSGLIGIGTLSSLVGAFIYGSQQRKQERGESRKEELKK